MRASPEQQPRLNICHHATPALKLRFASLLSPQLTFASCREVCETWSLAIGRQMVANSSVYVSQHCLMSVGRLPTNAPYFASHVCSRSPGHRFRHLQVQRYLASFRLHTTGISLASWLTAVVIAKIMVPHSMHIPGHLVHHVHASFCAIDRLLLNLPGSEEPNCFHSTCLPWPVAASDKFTCRVLAHRTPAAALAEVAASLRDSLISIRTMAGGLVMRLLP